MNLTQKQKVEAYLNALRRIGWEVNFSQPANYEGIHILTIIKHDPATGEIETFKNFTGRNRVEALKKALRKTI